MHRGERLRKREAERAEKRAKKRRKLGKKPLTVDKSGGYESQPKKHTNKRRLEVPRSALLANLTKEKDTRTAALIACDG